MPAPDMLSQIAAIATFMPTIFDRTNIRLLATMRPLMGLMLRLGRSAMAAPRIGTHILPLSRMLGQMVLQLLLGAEGLPTLDLFAAVRNDSVWAYVFMVV